jgi:hypothetical protein
VTPEVERRLAAIVFVIWLVSMTVAADAEFAILIALILAWCKGTAANP